MIKSSLGTEVYLNFFCPEISPALIQGQQQDAQEFYVKIMEKLGSESERFFYVNKNSLCVTQSFNSPV